MTRITEPRPLTPAALAEAKRILDAAARRLLAERLAPTADKQAP